ncbi:MAG: hydratase [Treponema sp.]|jgi:aconitate hydratase|nr:hydratase [Treponema sp.]
MIDVLKHGVYYINNSEFVDSLPGKERPESENEGRKGSMAYRIMAAHQCGGDVFKKPALKFDSLVSHDITFVNIIQTAKVSGLEKFPVPYVLTNCHNSLCAVGGTINEDDHVFGLSAAKKYGGVYVPPHLAVIHSYIREARAGCGRMILGSDSHTRYGALGAMGVGEGGGELVKQLLEQSYETSYPRVIAVYLSGKPRHGVGPQDIALALIGAVFRDGFVKNAVLEFVGPGIRDLPMDFRAGIDVMTTETTCWSSIWETDERVKDFLSLHGRPGDYEKITPGPLVRYDGLIKIDLSTIKPMIALPFHPSNACEIDEFLANTEDILDKVEKEALETLENSKTPLKLRQKIEGKGRFRTDQGIIAGCAGGTFDNIMTAAAILKAGGDRDSRPGAFSLSVYPGSQPVMLELAKNGVLAELISRGVVVRSAFCGPCFGAGDVPSNGGFSVRHTTRNFPNREGSKPDKAQIASVALMDARSVAATAGNGGILRSAENVDYEEKEYTYHYDESPYRERVYNGWQKAEPAAELVYGPNITDWPDMEELGENLLIKIVSFITDPVTTTDELIPSGETSSFRSNPQGLSEYTLSRKDPAYVGRARELKSAASALKEGGEAAAVRVLPELETVFKKLSGLEELKKTGGPASLQLGSAIYARKPGDGSAREQAASCQRVLGAAANFAAEYATKRYRSNLINWGIIPFIVEGEPPFENGDWIFIPRVTRILKNGGEKLEVFVIGAKGITSFPLASPELNEGEALLLGSGSLINLNRRKLAGLKNSIEHETKPHAARERS